MQEVRGWQHVQHKHWVSFLEVQPLNTWLCPSACPPVLQVIYIKTTFNEPPPLSCWFNLSSSAFPPKCNTWRKLVRISCRRRVGIWGFASPVKEDKHRAVFIVLLPQLKMTVQCISFSNCFQLKLSNYLEIVHKMIFVFNIFVTLSLIFLFDNCAQPDTAHKHLGNRQM